MALILKIIDNGNRDLDIWSLIEIQGDLESRTATGLETKFIGDLCFTNNVNGSAILIIGHHILHGKIQDLDKPLAVMERNLVTQEHSQNSNGYTIKAIVTKKITFKTRPKPIISNN